MEPASERQQPPSEDALHARLFTAVLSPLWKPTRVWSCGQCHPLSFARAPRFILSRRLSLALRKHLVYIMIKRFVPRCLHHVTRDIGHPHNRRAIDRRHLTASYIAVTEWRVRVKEKKTGLKKRCNFFREKNIISRIKNFLHPRFRFEGESRKFLIRIKLKFLGRCSTYNVRLLVN